jgi:hypothetical protein
MTLELTDEQVAALLKELNCIIDGKWRFFTRRHLRHLREIRAMLRPEPPQLLLPHPPKA